MGPYGSLWGHHSQTSEVKSDVSFKISDPNYLLIHMYITYMVCALSAASEANTALEFISNLRFEISDLNYLYSQSSKASLLVKK